MALLAYCGPAVARPSLSPASVRSRLLQCPRPSPRRRLPPEFHLRRGCGSRPLTSEGLSSDPLTSSAEGLTEPRPVPAAPRSGRGTVLLRRPGPAAGCQPAPEKVQAVVRQQQRFRDGGKAQRAPGPGLHPQRPRPSTGERGRSPGAAGTFARGGPRRLCQMSSRQGNRLSRGALWPEDPPDLTLLPRIRPSRQSPARLPAAAPGLWGPSAPSEKLLVSEFLTRPCIFLASSQTRQLGSSLVEYMLLEFSVGNL
ncbi:translation initiation factor IF-2-like [Panthera leo]|uniref:translation initiation factor IF-2-like n=1 Tax=Panthera leo TaxID=9689 RepID=UPI001C699FD9|nr:translation initiation factor IF-2-like [Panthera leo]